MFTNILITLDGSGYGERVLAYGPDLARPAEARVTLLRVVPTASAPSATDSRETEAMDYLGARQVDLSRLGLGDVELMVRTGEPAAEILEAARVLKADLIAMSTQGGGARSEEGLGSVAAQVLRAAPCPVLLVRVHRPAPPSTLAEERWQAEGGANVG